MIQVQSIVDLITVETTQGVIVGDYVQVLDNGIIYLWQSGDSANLNNWILSTGQNGFKYEGGIPIAIGYAMQANRPLDTREIVNTRNDLLVIPNCYPGISVKVADEDYKIYSWNGVDQTNSTNWSEIVGSGGVSDHTKLTNIGIKTHPEIDTHIGDTAIHVSAQDRINWDTAIGGVSDHTELTSIGTNTHVQLDDHVADAAIHVSPADRILWDTPGGVDDHFDLLNIGVKTHVEIDSHIGDATIHYPQSAITITESQISDLKTYQETSEKGQVDGYASLGGDGKVPTGQLPSYVDDVLEYPTLGDFPAIGEAGKIYIALDTNKTYRWSGSVYIYITSGAVDSVNTKTGIVVLDKTDIGLSNVDNTSDADKPISTATQTALDDKITSTLAADLDANGNSITNVDTITYISGGTISWNGVEHSLDIDTTLGTTITMGQETLIFIYNDTGVTMTKGQVMHPYLGYEINGDTIPTVRLAKADNFLTCQGTLSVVTNNILPGAFGFTTLFGKVDNYNTALWPNGSLLYLSADVSGALTNVKPSFPNYVITMGGVSKSSALGQVFIGRSTSVGEINHNFFNGTMQEPMSLSVTSNGTIVTGYLDSKAGDSKLTLKFSDGMTNLPVPTSVQLIVGTDSIPQLNYVYVPKSTKVLTTSAVSFPDEEHIKCGLIGLQSALHVQSDGHFKLQVFNDPLEGTNGQGHLSHITERLRLEGSRWYDGCAATNTVTSSTNYISVATGHAYQLHKQTIPAFDMPANEIYIPNHPTANYTEVTDLAGQLLDSNGVSLNNTSFSFVLWCSVNSDGTAQFFINLPNGSYSKTTPELAVSDTLNYAVMSVPPMFATTAFLVARFTYVVTSGAWSLFDSTDLRGTIIGTVAGGAGGGSGGASTFSELTDTPINYGSAANKIVAVNALETGLEYIDAPVGVTDHTLLTNIGVQTHPQIDTHIGTSSIHYLQGDISIPASQITDFDTEVSNNVNVAANTAKTTLITVTGATNLDTLSSDVALNNAKISATGTELEPSDIGVTIQAFDVDIVSDSAYVHTDNNYDANAVAVTASATTHIADTVIHVTQADKDNWNTSDNEFQELEFIAQPTPTTVVADSYKMFSRTSGVTPNKIVEMCVINEALETIILSSVKL